MDEKDKRMINDDESSEFSGRSRKNKKANTRRTLLIVVLSVVMALCIGVFVVLGWIFHYIDKLNIVDTNSSYEILDSIPDDEEIYIDENGNEVDSMPDSPEELINDIEAKIKENAENNTGKKIKDSSDSKAADTGTTANYDGNYGTSTYGFDFKDDNVYNVLLIGTDARTPDERGRSDSMILISINKNTKRITMTSFLRDIYLYIPGVEYTRLNHAYAYGGAELLLETLRTNFRIPIEKYVQVDFTNFRKVVDAVGGIEIEITDDEVYYINQNCSTPVTHSGLVTLNGAQALSYSRIRKIGTDFGRTERQRKVLDIIMMKMHDMSIGDLTDLLDEILPNITTNLTKDELFNLIADYPVTKNYDRLMLRVPADNTWWNLTIRGMMVLGIDFDSNLRYLGENIYDHYE